MEILAYIEKKKKKKKSKLVSSWFYPLISPSIKQLTEINQKINIQIV
jgi:hypothetical protein